MHFMEKAIMNPVETVNIWRRNHDKRWQVCMTVRVAPEAELFRRVRQSFDTYMEAIIWLKSFKG